MASTVRCTDVSGAFFLFPKLKDYVNVLFSAHCLYKSTKEIKKEIQDVLMDFKLNEYSYLISYQMNLNPNSAVDV